MRQPSLQLGRPPFFLHLFLSLPVFFFLFGLLIFLFVSPLLPSFPFRPFLVFPLPLPLEVGRFECSRGYRERCKLPNGLWGGAPTEIKFGVFGL